VGERRAAYGKYTAKTPPDAGSDRAFLAALTDLAVLSEQSASATVTIPSYAQGAAIAPSGKLWVSRSEIGRGSLEKLDIASDLIQQRYAVPGGIEGISLDASGRMWATANRFGDAQACPAPQPTRRGLRMAEKFPGGLRAGNATAEYRRTSQRFSVAGRRAARRRRCRPAWSAFRIVEPPPG
jgi:hypothetical protein